jgi:hypothetical protein
MNNYNISKILSKFDIVEDNLFGSLNKIPMFFDFVKKIGESQAHGICGFSADSGQFCIYDKMNEIFNNKSVNIYGIKIPITQGFIDFEYKNLKHLQIFHMKSGHIYCGDFNFPFGKINWQIHDTNLQFYVRISTENKKKYNIYARQ